MRSRRSRKAADTHTRASLKLQKLIFPAKHYGMIYHLQRTCSPAPCCRWPWPQSTSVGGPPPDAACSGWCSLGRRTSTNKQRVTVTRSFWHHNQAWIKMVDDQLADFFFFSSNIWFTLWGPRTLWLNTQYFNEHCATSVHLQHLT